MKKKITAFLLLMCMLVGVFGNADVYAGTSSNSVSKSISLVFQSGEKKTYNYYNLPDDALAVEIKYSNSDYNYYMIFSLSSFEAEYNAIYYDADGEITGEYNNLKLNGAAIDVPLSDNTVGCLFTSGGYLGDKWTASGIDVVCAAASEKDAYASIYNYLKNGSDDNITSLFDVDTATYDKNLGYLQNVKFTAGYIKVWDELLNKYVKSEDFSGKYRFQWGNLSTSGFDLTTANTYVRLYSSVGVYSNSNGYEENLCSGFPKNFIHQYVASDLQLIIDINDFLEGSQEDFEKLCEMTTMATWLLKGYYRQDTVYLQIVNCGDSGSWTYGGFLKVTTDSNGDITGTPVTPDGGRDIDGGSEQDIPSDEETGVEWSDVWDNDDDEDDDGNGNSVFFEWSDIPDLLSDISSFFNYVLRVAKDLISQVGDFPALFSKVLAFLPDAVQQSITAGFIIAIILRLLGR